PSDSTAIIFPLGNWPMPFTTFQPLFCLAPPLFAFGISVTPSTSSPKRSGQYSSIDCLMPSSRVLEDEGHPLQFPASLNLATPFSRLTNSTLPPWLSIYGFTFSSAL